MRRVVPVLTVLVMLAGVLGAEPVMNGLFEAADQVAADLTRVITREGDLLIGAVEKDRVAMSLGDLFADLVANRLAGRSGFRARVVKNYTSLQYPPGQAAWVLKGSLYKAGAGWLFTLQLQESASGVQLKGWEFALGNDGMDALLQPSVLATAGGAWDRFEPNDAPLRATVPVLPLDESGLTLGDGDEDWFAIEVGASSGNRVLILDAATGGVMDTYMELYAPGDTDWPVVENDDSDGGNAAIEIPLNQPGTWYLKVRAYASEEEGEYSIRIRLREEAYGPGEPDEGVDRATRLNVGTPPLSKIIDYSSDEDWFRINLVRPLGMEEVLRIETTGYMDLMMRLLDEYGDYITEDDDSGVDSNPMVMTSGLGAGTYYAVVSTFSGETGPYEIMANVTVPVRDQFEDDGSMESASNITPNGVPQRRTFSPVGDIDWVTFQITRDGPYRMSTRGDIDTYMELYDARGYLMDENDDGEDYNARIERNLPAGTYFLSVSPYGGAGPDDPYELVVEQLR